MCEQLRKNLTESNNENLRLNRLIEQNRFEQLQYAQPNMQILYLQRVINDKNVQLNHKVYLIKRILY